MRRKAIAVGIEPTAIIGRYRVVYDSLWQPVILSDFCEIQRGAATVAVNKLSPPSAAKR
jgi:hypothetical protein